jgi:hypothetical protein
MAKLFTIIRNGQLNVVLVRQMPHDRQYKVGAKFKYGSGPRWTVTAIDEAGGNQ